MQRAFLGCGAVLATLVACGAPQSPAPIGVSSPRAERETLDASAGDAGPPSDAAADAPGPDALAAAGPVPGPCPTDMVALPLDGDAGQTRAYCIDRYEAPNQPGAMPLAFQTADDGEAWCAARGKRLCREDEWVRACKGSGSSHRAYPYGARYDPSRCNDTKIWKPPKWGTLARYPRDAATAEADRLYQADPSGTREGCVSEEGVYDMTGNVAEWVERTWPTPHQYPQLIKGCFWSGCYKTYEVSCDFRNAAHPGDFRSYEVGFRCCKEQDEAR